MGVGSSELSVGRMAAVDAGESVDEMMSAFESDVPPWFAEELFDASEAIECYASAEHLVWSFVFEGSADDRYVALCSSLSDRGWSCVESGVDRCATFVRGEGEYRWALVSCSSVGDTVATVVQLQR